MSETKSDAVKGAVYIVLSCLFASLASVLVKFASNAQDVPALLSTLSRFLIGGVYMFLFMKLKHISFHPNRKKFIALRAISNTAGVILLYVSLQFTTVTNTNMLSSAAPIFVFMILPFLKMEKVTVRYFLYLALAALGVYLVMNPNFQSINLGDLLALVSAAFSAVAIVSLREGSKYDSAEIIIFYLMVVGAVVNTLLILPSIINGTFRMPTGLPLLCTLGAGVMGFLNQIAITNGYRYISASAGSIIGNSVILFSVFFGWIFFDEVLTIPIFLGGSLILISILGVTVNGATWKKFFHVLKSKIKSKS